MKIHRKIAKHVSYGEKRSRKSVKYIVIHYTGNNGDTAKGNANYFAYANTRAAGAHFFVGQKGSVYKSVPMNRVAWSVGGRYDTDGGAGFYYLKCTNANSVSIELCDNMTKDPSNAQVKAVKELIKYIQKWCPNAKTIIRHWDVNGKDCPIRMIGTGNDKWRAFLRRVR